MKKLLRILLALCILGLSGCAAPLEQGDGIDLRPAIGLAQERFADKMQAEGVAEYKIEESAVYARSGSTVFDVTLIYTADGGEEQNYLYRIQCENGAAEVLDEGEYLGSPYPEK